MEKGCTISYRSPHVLAGMPGDAAVLLALSGGEDSSVLLHLLAEDARREGYPLFAAHFNHRIRGEEAERDARFCRELADSLGIPLIVGSADVPALAREHGTGLEEEARELRYAFFAHVMEERGIKLLVTAHHAMDQAETVLLHMLRGSGTEGLRGILPCRPFGDGFIVRPLLEVKKSDISRYAAENNIEFVTDSTNSDDAYARNFLRSRVIPLLTELQPSLERSLARLAENVGQADDLIEFEALNFLKDKPQSSLPLAELQKLHPAPRSRAISIAFETVSGGSHLEKVHIDSLLSLCERARPHSSISLPRGFCGAIEGDSLVFSTDAHGGSAELADYEIPLAEGCYCPCDGVRLEITQVEAVGRKDPNTLYIPKSLADGALIRPRRPGDEIRLRKMTRSVKKLLNEKKLPIELRSRLPLLARGSDVLWIPSLAIGDGVFGGGACGGILWRITVRLEPTAEPL